jgi:hypothetical protein
MAAASKSAKAGGAKKTQVKIGDMKPAKDAKGGGKASARHRASSNRRQNVN